ncbi:MAG: hypothetical protein J5687_07895 [Treponema sp.]|nr:hypothetical protein [Treponema sp.]
MNAAEVKREIEEAIEIANSNPVTIYVEAEEGSGTVTPTQLRLKKKERFELRYKPSSSWRFIKWEVRDRETKEVVTDVIQFDDETALETKAKVLVPREGLEIYAKAVIIPAVVSVSPLNGSTNDAYVPIQIYFNTPVEEPDEEASLFNFDNISITSSNRPVDDFFEEPVFNNDKTVLTIMPKPVKIYNYVQANNIQIFDVTVSLSNRIVVTQGDVDVGLADDNISFSIRYKAVIETDEPKKSKFFASGFQITEDNVDSFSEDNKIVLKNKYYRENKGYLEPDRFTQKEIMKNRTTGLIYIYGKYIDEGSGVKEVTISESRTHDYTDSELSSEISSLPVTYNSQNALFVQKGDTTEFFITHEVKTKAGAVLINVKIADVCDNSTSESFYVYKVTEQNFISFSPRNYGINLNPEYYKSSIYSQHLKKIRIPLASFEEQIYRRCFIEDEDGDPESGTANIEGSELSVNCYINDSNESLSWTIEEDPSPYSNDEVDEFLVFDLSSFSSIAGLKARLEIKDDIGNSLSKDFYFPKEPSVMTANGKVYVYSGGQTTHVLIIKLGQDGSETVSKLRNSDAFVSGIELSSLSEGEGYKLIPINTSGHDESYSDYCFWGESCPITYSTAAIQNLDYSVELKENPVMKYLPEYGKWGFNIILADNSWSKFDSIYYIVTSPYEEGPYCFESNTYKLSYTISGTDEFIKNTYYSNNIEMSVYGIKNNKISAALNKTIISKTNEAGKYDVIPPVCNLSRPNPYEYELKCNDKDSGLNSVYLIKKDGTKELLYDEIADNERKILSASKLEDEADEAGVFMLEVTDIKGNSKIVTGNKPDVNNKYYAPSRLKKDTTNKWFFEQSLGNSDYFYISQINKKQGLNEWYWSEPVKSEKVVGQNYSFWGTGSGGTTGFSINDNVFIRIDNLYVNSGGNTYSAGYSYFYTDGVGSSGNYDYIQKLSDSILLITTDAPAFVQTIKTDKPYSECKNWTTEEWELYSEPIGVVEMKTFSSTNTTSQKYSIPLSEINKGECYVVIAYFSKLYLNMSQYPKRMEPYMTEVMVKN